MCIKPAWIFALIEVRLPQVNSMVTPIPAPKRTWRVPSCGRGEGGGMCGMGGARYNGSGSEIFKANGAVQHSISQGKVLAILGGPIPVDMPRRSLPE